MKSRRAPFVVTIALAAVGSGCGGSTSSGEGSGGTTSGGSGGSVSGGTGGIGTGGYGANPPSIPCPADLPAEGSACPTGNFWGNTCAFPDPCGKPEPFYAECNLQTGQWHLLGSTACGCPTAQPSPGTACSLPSTQYCSYDDGCCPTGFSCQDGLWVETGVSCNPPFLECPATVPTQGEACNDCALGLENCAWNQQCNGGPWQYFGSCLNGAWTISQSPCLYDGGIPNPPDGGVIIIDGGNPPWPDGGFPLPDGGVSVLDGGGPT